MIKQYSQDYYPPDLVMEKSSFGTVKWKRYCELKCDELIKHGIIAYTQTDIKGNIAIFWNDVTKK
jgi:hypothetical protein